MEAEGLPAKRHKCPACYKQYKKKEHFLEHIKASCHSVHQPKCGVCQKHLKSFDSLREHLIGTLAKKYCSSIFSALGCDLCLTLFSSTGTLREHRESCRLFAPVLLGTEVLGHAGSVFSILHSSAPGQARRGSEAIAIDCEMVGGGSDGSLDLCARVCLVDEDENLIFHTYVQPQHQIVNYRYAITGLTEEHLKNAMPLKEVQEKVLQILQNGESPGKSTLGGGKRRLLVGHSLEYDLECLNISYPDNMLRDTAKYCPLMKTNLASHSLKYLTQTYLGYDIQLGIHDPYEDCVSVMRLYKRMRGQHHRHDGIEAQNAPNDSHDTFSNFDSWSSEQLENFTLDQLYKASLPDYRCWCLDWKEFGS